MHSKKSNIRFVSIICLIGLTICNYINCSCANAIEYMAVMPLLDDRIPNISFGDTVSSNEGIRVYINNVVKEANTNLGMAEVNSNLKKNRRKISWGKWGVVALTGITTILGVIGSSSASDNNKRGLLIATTSLGAASTIFALLRDDKDTTDRIIKCENIIRTGRAAIDVFNAKWSGTLLTLPELDQTYTGENREDLLRKRNEFIDSLRDDAIKLYQDIDSQLTVCH